MHVDTICYCLEPMDDWNAFLEKLAFDLRDQITKHGLPADAPRMVGLLFARPQSTLSKAEILPNLGYFHVRSGQFISLFCAGYSEDSGWEDSEEVCDLKGKRWSFSNTGFDQIRRRLENGSKWQYAGGVQLILTNARLNGFDTAILDLSSAICANLDEMKSAGAITSVESFFETLCRYAEDPNEVDPTWGFSDKAGVKIAGTSLKSLILSLLPKSLGADVQKAAHFAVVDISKPSTSSPL
jgi:hypothetical protein